MKNYNYHKIPQSRIATFDILSLSQSKNHISALLEFDVTESRIKLRELKRNGVKVSFNAWLLKVIGKTLDKHRDAAAFLVSKKKIITFNDINIFFIVEKILENKKVPIPLVIEKVNEKSIVEINLEIENSREKKLSGGDIILNKKSGFYERLYYKLPAFLRKMIWRFLLLRPKTAYKNMGNAAVTSLGMIGQINGWFIHKSIHPLSFGIGSIIKKGIVINDEIKIREVLNMTILFDHNVIDGAPMVRFIKDLTKRIEQGDEL